MCAAARHSLGPQQAVKLECLGEGIGAGGNLVQPVLRVADLRRAVVFYTTVLGFGVAWRAGNSSLRSTARPGT